MLLREKFDLLELLKLAIVDANEKGKELSKSVIVGEIAFLPREVQLWALLLVNHIEHERIVKITEAKPRTKKVKCVSGAVWQRRIADKPGKVKVSKGDVKSNDFFRMRNIVARKIHEQMIKDNFRPRNCRGDLSNLAKGMAEVVLRGSLFVKGMCGACNGLGKHEVYKDGEHTGFKFCESCNATGKVPYTIKEKIQIAKLVVAKSGYAERYAKYENLGESIIATYENQIRTQLARSLCFDETLRA